jgi:hypothetical protein
MFNFFFGTAVGGRVMTRTNARLICRVAFIILSILSSSVTAQQPMPPCTQEPMSGKSDVAVTPSMYEGQVFLMFCITNQTGADIWYNILWNDFSIDYVVTPMEGRAHYMCFNNMSEVDYFMQQNNEPRNRPHILYDIDMSPVDTRLVSFFSKVYLSDNINCATVPEYHFINDETSGRFIRIIEEY